MTTIITGAGRERAKRRPKKSCPFCGETMIDVKSQQHYGLWHWAQCCGCGARGPRVKSRRAALTAWNKPLKPRTSPGEPKPMAPRPNRGLARMIAMAHLDVPPIRVVYETPP